MFFEELETKRLMLKNISFEDRTFMFKQFSDEEVTRYLFDEEPMKELSEADELIKIFLQPEPRSHHRWILVLKDTEEKIGTCGFHCWDKEKQCVEMGYDLSEKYWGKGYMAESVNAILAFARDEMKVKRIDAHVYPENVGSMRLVEKFNFVQTEETKIYEFRGKEYLHYIYSLTF